VGRAARRIVVEGKRVKVRRLGANYMVALVFFYFVFVYFYSKKKASHCSDSTRRGLNGVEGSLKRHK